MGGVTVNVSGFNRVDGGGAWSTAWRVCSGLRVTNFSEGDGSSNRHVVDNIGGNRDYVLFEFDSSIVVTQAFLDYVYNGDSDMSVWIGTKPNPTVLHNTLSDAFLASIGPQEDNDTTLTTSRWAVFNAANRCGNVVVISASASDTTPEDTFKIHKLHFGCCGGATPTPTPTATATATATAAPTPTPTPTCSPSTFVFEGNSATSGTAGNIRTYTVSGVTVKVSGFNRVDSSGAWSTAWLGVYTHGLGVTNFSEGNGDSDRHVVDNIGGNRDYVLFEFSSSIVVDQAYLDYIIGDSDMSAWIGTKTNPTDIHNTLSDAFLASIGPREDNDTTSSGVPRWADINAANRSGNVLVISASASDTTPEDGFKIRKLLFGCQGGTPSPTPTATPACGTITLSPSTLPNGRKNHSYSQTITASGGTSPYTFSKTSGSLPPGLSLSSGGVLSGTPTSTAPTRSRSRRKTPIIAPAAGRTVLSLRVTRSLWS